MTFETFVWTDLSTFDLAVARSDYAALFDWQFTGDESYDFALEGAEPVAALFPMPQKLVDIQMPSFWMSYVRVADLEKAVDRARAHQGVIIEIEPMAFDAQARVALVRDPSGAGFTLYEGPDLTVSSGTRRYHHVPDVTLIEGFYRDLFGWTFEEVGQNPWPVYDIRHRHGDLVAQVEEVPETIRGKFRYWMPCFTVPEPQTFLDKLTLQGGNVQTPLDEDRWMVSDRQGAAFMIRISS